MLNNRKIIRMLKKIGYKNNDIATGDHKLAPILKGIGIKVAATSIKIPLILGSKTTSEP